MSEESIDTNPPHSARALKPEEEALLLLVFASEEPIGARVAQRALRQSGFALSEASISRAFTRLDSLGLTAALHRKGRILTAAGRQLAESRVVRGEREERFMRAMDLRSLDEIDDWVAARQLLESRAAEMAATRRTDADIALLERSLDAHLAHLDGDQDVSPIGHEFHQVVMKASGSPIFIALIGSLYARDFLRVERTLDEILIRQGVFKDSWTYHERILEALRRRDGPAAGAAMWDHLELFRGQVRSFASSATGSKAIEIV